MQTRPRSSLRPGFTLVEMMIVIGIITMLAALLLVAIGQAGSIARQRATAATIRKVSNQVQERLEALDRLKSQPQWAQDAQSFANLYGVSFNQAKILMLKYRMKELFPQSVSELQAMDNRDWYVNEYARFLASSSNANLSLNNPETQSSALLYYMLTNGRVPGVPTVNPGEYRSTEVADTDGDGFLEFVDAWGRPLRFYRWPTRLFFTGTWNTSVTPPLPVVDRSQGGTLLFKDLPPNDLDLVRDQDDPTLLLYDTNSNAPVMQLFTEANYHTPRTYHHFLLVSSGPDGATKSADEAFGLYNPTRIDTNNGIYGTLAQPIQPFTPAVRDAMTDNISNRNQ